MFQVPMFVNGKPRGGGDGEGSGSAQDKEHVPMTAVKDSLGTIMMRFVIIQGIPLTFMCFFCYKVHRMKSKKTVNKDNNY